MEGCVGGEIFREKRSSFFIMQDRLKAIWRLAGGFELADIKFNLDEDRAKVMEGSPWMIFYHYVSIQTWTPKFASLLAQIEKTVWIRFSRLEYVVLC